MNKELFELNEKLLGVWLIYCYIDEMNKRYNLLSPSQYELLLEFSNNINLALENLHSILFLAGIVDGGAYDER